MTEFALEGAAGEIIDFAKRAEHDREVAYLTYRGKRVAAIVPSEIAEAVEAAEDRAELEAARAAMAEPGESIPWECLRVELGL